MVLASRYVVAALLPALKIGIESSGRLSRIPDVGGICLPQNPSRCGGFGAIQCQTGMSCVDDQGDSCDPNAGGADCGGVCVPQQ